MANGRNELDLDGWNWVPFPIVHVPISEFVPDLLDFYLQPRIVKMLLAQVHCMRARINDTLIHDVTNPIIKGNNEDDDNDDKNKNKNNYNYNYNDDDHHHYRYKHHYQNTTTTTTTVAAAAPPSPSPTPPPLPPPPPAAGVVVVVVLLQTFPVQFVSQNSHGLHLVRHHRQSW